MSYQIINYPAVIKFISEEGECSLAKNAVTRISAVREDLLKINYGDCASGIFIRHRNVTAPITTDILALIEALNEMLIPYTPSTPAR